MKSIILIILSILLFGCATSQPKIDLQDYYNVGVCDGKLQAYSKMSNWLDQELSPYDIMCNIDGEQTILRAEIWCIREGYK